MKIIKNIIKHKYFRYFLVITWMVVIFMFSNDNAAVSDGKSNFIIKFLNNCGINLNDVFKSYADFVVRKAAHFMEYFILSLLLINALKDDFDFKRDLLLAILFTFLYACTDEFHQTFIEGRAGKLRDVLIDTCGGAFASLVVWIFKGKS